MVILGNQMLPITEPQITLIEDEWLANCLCGKLNKYSSKAKALAMLKRGSCRYCKKDYRNVKNTDANIYQNKFGKWCSICSGCNAEQAYTRKDHAKQSSVADWQCKTCVQSLKRFAQNKPIGSMQRYYNRFKKSAFNRKIPWAITFEYIFELFDGHCSLTGWEIFVNGSSPNASIDRIDSGLGYENGNVRWVHKLVNMCKNKYSDDDFVNMCLAVAARHDQSRKMVTIEKPQ
jgi:hypothetical protein